MIVRQPQSLKNGAFDGGREIYPYNGAAAPVNALREYRIRTEKWDHPLRRKSGINGPVYTGQIKRGVVSFGKNSATPPLLTNAVSGQ